MRIRPSTPADREHLIPLIEGYFDFYQTPFPGKQKIAALLDTLQTDERLGVQLVAEEGERLLGFVTLYACFDTLVAGPILVMNDLYVSPNARGGGTGTGLLRAAREFARTHGYLRLDWVTAKDNIGAQRLYDREGGQKGPWIPYSLPILD